MEPNYPLDSDPGMKHHRPIMSILDRNGGRSDIYIYIYIYGEREISRERERDR